MILFFCYWSWQRPFLWLNALDAKLQSLVQAWTLNAENRNFLDWKWGFQLNRSLVSMAIVCREWRPLLADITDQNLHPHRKFPLEALTSDSGPEFPVKFKALERWSLRYPLDGSLNLQQLQVANLLSKWPTGKFFHENIGWTRSDLDLSSSTRREKVSDQVTFNWSPDSVHGSLMFEINKIVLWSKVLIKTFILFNFLFIVRTVIRIQTFSNECKCLTKTEISMHWRWFKLKTATRKCQLLGRFLNVLIF